MAIATVTAADLRIVLTGPEFEPTGPAWNRASEAERRAYWKRLVEIAYFIKRQEIARGIGADGKKLPPVKPSSRPDGAKGPPLDPHYGESRTARLLAYSSTATGATLYWRAAGRKSWAVILGYHARVGGEVRGAPLRDTLGISPRGRKQVAAQARQWWATGHGAAPVRPPRPAPKPTPPKPAPAPTPPAPAAPPPPLPLPEAVPAGRPILPGRPIADRIAAYTEGDRKIARILEIRTEIDRLEAEVEAIRSEWRAAEKRVKAKDLGPRADAEGVARRERSERLYGEYQAATAAVERAQRGERGRVADLLAAPNPTTVAPVHPPGLTDTSGNPFDPPDARSRAAIDDAAAWLGRLLAAGEADRLDVAIGQARPGQVQRAQYNTRRNYIRITPDTPAATVVHELGHALEEQIRTGGSRALERGLEFLAHRVGPEPTVKLRDIAPQGNFRDDEEGRKDKFDSVYDELSAYYVGKDYGQDATEIVSMGLELLYNNPVLFAQKDPEYLKFVLGILDGSLR